MMFFGTRKPADPTQAKHRSLLGVLFVPDVKDSIRPMGEALSVFVNMVAMLFAMNGLFPKDHPALKGAPGARLTLSEILNTAWKDLSFTQRGMPKVLLFFAVAGGIVLAILSIITALALGFIGQAHAQTTGPFTLSNAGTDLAANWLNFLFSPDSTTSGTAGTNLQTNYPAMVLPSSTIQSALGTALGVYSNAILVIAAFILFYHLTAMVVETAHHGVPMGKRASQIWAPIRLVVAIGLLVPINGTLNSGQYIVLQMAQWGSALATNVWGTFVTALAKDTQIPPLAQQADVSNLVADLTMMYACEYSYNYQVASGASSGLTVGADDQINGWPWTQTGTPIAPPNGVTDSNGFTKYSFTNNLASDYDLCGSYTIPPAPTASPIATSLKDVAATIYKSTTDDFMAASKQAATRGTEMQWVMKAPSTFIPAGTYPRADDITADAATFNKSLSDHLQAALAGMDFSTIMGALTTNTQKQGWVSAGSWFNQLSAVESEISSYAQSSMPTTTPPKIMDGDDKGKADHALKAKWWSLYHDEHKNARSAYTQTIKDLIEFEKDIAGGAPPPPSAAAPAATAVAPSLTPTRNFWSRIEAGLSPLYLILSMVEDTALMHNVWGSPAGGSNNGNTTANNSSGLALGVQFKGANPLMEIAAFGHNCIDASVDYFDKGIVSVAVAAGVSFVPGASALGKIASGIGGILFFFGVLFFTVGAALAFVVPLLPFIHFFFNTITWVACVAESILAIPMVALAHLTPEGEGLPGQAAKGAYYMIFSVFLRPVLMIFGLICGLLIMLVAAGLLNVLYALAVAGSGTVSSTIPGGAHLVISRIMFTIIYVVLLYSVANHAFALIGRFPNQAMEWMGGKGLHGEKMGDPGHIASGITVASGYFGSKMTDQLNSLSKGVGEIGSNRTARRKEEAAEAKQTGMEYGKQGWTLPSELANNRSALEGYALGSGERADNAELKAAIKDSK